uniref:Uncharacterized protein n=1 Tax=Alexandrium monilatum TaxID=311494 RepID=A0A7S4VHV8_9DINO
MTANPLSGTPFATLVSEDIRQFINTHNLDESARAKLEALPMDQQVDVISQDVANVRNISAVVISRASRCQREGSKFAGPSGQEYVAGIVAKFVAMLGLDEKAAASLKNLPAKDQVAVMVKDMEGVTNPSGVVDSRVRKIQQSGLTIQQAGFVGRGASVPTGGAPAPRLGATVPTDATQYLEQAYQAFLAQYNVDLRAQEQVSQLSPLEKLEVISQSMDNVYNPSGAVASRCAKVKGRPVVLGPRAAQWVAEVAQLFCKSFGIDSSSDAFSVLQALPADKQFEVCSQSLAGARNPQSVLYCRMQKLSGTPVAPQALGYQTVPALQAPHTLSMMGCAGGEVESFIARYKLDERAAGVLRDLAARDPTAAEEVMRHPITAEVRNPSGVIHARVTSRMGVSKRAGAAGAALRAAPY